MTGETVDAVAVADGLQGVHHQHDRFFFDVDDAPLRPLDDDAAESCAAGTVRLTG